MMVVPYKVDGNILYAKDLYKDIGSDTTHIGAVGSQSGYIEIGSFPVSGGIIGSWIDITFNFFSFAGNVNASPNRYSIPGIDLCIGVSGSESSVREFYPLMQVFAASNDAEDNSQQGTLTYTYYPTSGEKASGFNILFKAKNINVAGQMTGSATISGIWVKGI